MPVECVSTKVDGFQGWLSVMAAVVVDKSKYILELNRYLKRVRIEVNELVDVDITPPARAILQEGFVGVYLYSDRGNNQDR